MIGVIQHIDNNKVTDVLENSKYRRVTVYCKETNKYVSLLLTLNDFERLIKRQEKNLEDCYQPKLWEKFMHWIIRR